MAKVKVEYVHHTGDKKPGDQALVNEDEAVALVEAGVAKIVTDKK